jgi:Co/Zn/Cd efflux system component
MGRGHDHGGHSHAPANYGAAFAIGVTLNLGFVIAEVIYGRLAHSLALVADAGHNLSDVLGLMLAWGAIMLSRRTPTKERTYGFRRSSILAALTSVCDDALLAQTAKELHEKFGIEHTTLQVEFGDPGYPYRCRLVPAQDMIYPHVVNP